LIFCLPFAQAGIAGKKKGGREKRNIGSVNAPVSVPLVDYQVVVMGEARERREKKKRKGSAERSILPFLSTKKKRKEEEKRTLRS